MTCMPHGRRRTTAVRPGVGTTGGGPVRPSATRRRRMHGNRPGRRAAWMAREMPEIDALVMRSPPTRTTRRRFNGQVRFGRSYQVEPSLTDGRRRRAKRPTFFGRLGPPWTFTGESGCSTVDANHTVQDYMWAARPGWRRRIARRLTAGMPRTRRHCGDPWSIYRDGLGSGPAVDLDCDGSRR